MSTQPNTITPPARIPFSTEPYEATGLRVVERSNGEKFNLWGAVRFYDVYQGDKLIATHAKKSDAVNHARGKIVVVPVGYLGSGRGWNVWQGSEVSWFQTRAGATEGQR